MPPPPPPAPERTGSLKNNNLEKEWIKLNALGWEKKQISSLLNAFKRKWSYQNWADVVKFQIRKNLKKIPKNPQNPGNKNIKQILRGVKFGEEVFKGLIRFPEFQGVSN